MSQICPYCKSNKRIKKNGFYTVFNEFSEKEVPRFFCRSCGMAFSEHTTISKPAREASNGRLVFKRLKSKYKKEKEADLYSQITDYIVSYGLPKIEEITEELRISSKTYYKYLRKLEINLAGAFVEERKKVVPNELLLLEINKRHKKSKTKIRFLLLIDLKSKVIFNYFFYEKKRLRNQWCNSSSALQYEDRENLRLGYSYNSNQIKDFLLNLKNTYPDLTVQLSCSNYLKNKLLKSSPLVFKNANRKNLILINSNFNDYGIHRVLSFAYTLQIKKYAQYASVPKSIYKQKIKETLEALISIYNKHQMDIFFKNKNKLKISKNDLQDKHRRRSSQKKSVHIVRRKKMSLGN